MPAAKIRPSLSSLLDSSKKSAKASKFKPELTFKSAEYVQDSDSSSDSDEESAVGRLPERGRITQAPSETPLAKKTKVTNGSSPSSRNKKPKARSKTPSAEPSTAGRSEKEESGRGKVNGAQQSNGVRKKETSAEDSSIETDGGVEQANKGAKGAKNSIIKQRTFDGEEGKLRRPQNGLQGAKSDVNGAESESGSADEVDGQAQSITSNSSPPSPSRDTNQETSDFQQRLVSTSGKVKARRTADEESESEHESESESEELNAAESIQSSKQKDETGTPKPTKKVLPFLPPLGFTSADIAVEDASRTNDILDPEKLEGKQIWHITAPASLSLNLLHHISLQSLTDGSTVTSFEGNDYGFVPREHGGSKNSSILLPSVNENAYIPRKTAFQKNLHLQQLIKLPSHTLVAASTINASSSITPNSSKPRNEQPKGLKMRYHAFGIPGGSLSDSESDLERSSSPPPPSRPQFVPPEIPQVPSSPGKKRKHTSPDTNAPSSSKPKKSRKPKPDTTTPNQPTITPMSVDASSHTPQDLPATTRNQTPRLALPIPDSQTITPSKKQTKEERAKRKAEKHQNKLLQPFSIPRSVSPRPLPRPAHMLPATNPITNGDAQATPSAPQAERASQAEPTDDEDDTGDTSAKRKSDFVKASTLNGAPQEKTPTEDATHTDMPMEESTVNGIHADDIDIDENAATESKTTSKKGETPEEKAARKAAKRERKEARRKKREMKGAMAVVADE